IDHSAIAVSDTDKSLRFYRDLLGLEGNTSNLQAEEAQSQLDGLSLARVWISPLKARNCNIGIELLDYVSPRTGRSIPSEWSIGHLSHTHVVFEVASVEDSLDYLKQRWVKIGASSPIEFPSTYRYSRGALVSDPDDRYLLLASA
ncbi:MAG: VOC family protein, partial [Cyanobacteria bacterium J06597_1]